MSEARKMGRPSVDSEAITLRLPRELMEALDERRRIEPDLPTRPEMVRRLLMGVLDLPGKDLS